MDGAVKIEKNREELIKSIYKRVKTPINQDAILVNIESHGINIRNVLPIYGFNTLDELAKLVFEELSVLSQAKRTVKYARLEEYLVHWFFQSNKELFFKYYPRALLTLMPMATQLVGIGLGGYALWVYLPFSILETTIVYLALIAAMVFTGGYGQLFSKHLVKYYESGKVKTYRVKYYRSVINALVVVGIGCVAIYAAEYFIGFYPIWMVRIGLIYLFLISAMILLLTPLFAFKKHWGITLSFMGGLFVGLYVKSQTDLNIYQSHWAAVIAVIVCLIAGIEYNLRKEGKTSTEDSEYIKPVGLYLRIYNNILPFMYGTLFYLFGYIDRMVAWSAGADLPFMITFNFEYEIGVDLALIVNLIVSSTAMTYGIKSYNKFLKRVQRRTNPANAIQFSKSFKHFYFKNILLLVALQSVFFSTVLGFFLRYNGFLNQFVSDLTLTVYIFSSIGYICFTWGLINTLFILRLNNYALPTKVLLYSIVVNIIVGAICANFISFEYSLMGLIAGALTFSIMSYRWISKYFKNLDFYLYRAY